VGRSTGGDGVPGPHVGELVDGVFRSTSTLPGRRPPPAGADDLVGPLMKIRARRHRNCSLKESFGMAALEP
jgi:hypothetical protein